MIEDRYNKLCWYMWKVSGIDINKTPDSRKHPLPLLRAMVYKQLHDDGYTLKTIEKVVNKDHSSITHIIQTLVGVLNYPTKDDEDVVAIYDGFTELCCGKIMIEFTPSEIMVLKKLALKIGKYDEQGNHK